MTVRLSPSSPDLIARLRADLAPLTPLPPADRLDGLLHDQSSRWMRGVCVAVEAYRAAAPHLIADEDTLLCLISGELRLRCEAGDTLRPEEYRGRFPQYADALCRQIEVETALNEAGLGESIRESRLTAAFEPAAPPPPVPEVPGFEILSELGRGGMGVVYKARQVDLDRVVALKMIRGGPQSNPSLRERFRKEAKNVARLEHPSIVPVFAFGEHDGHLFFALKYVPGGSLASKLHGRGPWDARKAAGLVATLAAAVGYAHRQGIIHRDLKPANVLLDEHDTPFVTDFGLSRELQGSGLTLEGAAVGTPAYMSPEQAAGRHEAVGPHTDVFGLGAILFQLLTGRPPYQGPDVRSRLSQAEKGQIPPVREVNPTVPPALARVVDRALAAEPARRYPSAALLEADLRHFLRWQGWPWVAVAAGLMAMATALMAAVIVWNVNQARRYDTPPKPITSTEPNPLALPLYADFKIRFWSEKSPERKGRSITESGVLPLREGELVRFDLNLNRKGHVYILWIDSQGNIDPFYPWDRNDPKALFKPAPARDPIDRVMMPPEDDKGFPIEGESGLETVLVMVRHTPLPEDVRVGELIGRVPPSPLRDVGEVALRGWNGTEELPPYDQNRGPAKEAKTIDEPVLRLIAKVRPYFDQVRAVRFAYQK